MDEFFEKKINEWLLKGSYCGVEVAGCNLILFLSVAPLVTNAMIVFYELNVRNVEVGCVYFVMSKLDAGSGSPESFEEINFPI